MTRRTCLAITCLQLLLLRHADHQLTATVQGSGQPHKGELRTNLCSFSVDEGDEGVPEEQVRLDEVLVDVGDTLFYAYDFGDDWQHVIRLEAVLAREKSAPRAVCTGGCRPGPAEDCGGVSGYALLVAATDPGHPDHAAARAEYADLYGPAALS